MTTETLNIEISWPETLDVPAGATVNAQIWVGTEAASYRLICDEDVAAPATTSPATIAFTYNTEDLLPVDAETVWDHFHTSPTSCTMASASTLRALQKSASPKLSCPVGR